MRVVRPGDRRYSSPAQLPAASDLLEVGVKTIFVIDREIDVLPEDSPRNPMRRILIFDNHPESLRLLFDQFSGDSKGHSFERKRAISLGLFLLCILVMALGVAVLWPIL